MYLFIDTETTGLPKKWDAPLRDLSNWPRLVELGWVEYDKVGNEISSGDYIVEPKGYEIPEEAARIHKITTIRAQKLGKPLVQVLNLLNQLIENSDYIVAHNIEFDENVIGAEFLREYLKTSLFDKKRICTMKTTVDFMQLPSDKGGYRYPSLSDLHRKLFGENFKESHNALADIKATAKIYWELKNKNLVNFEKNIELAEDKSEDETQDEPMSLF